MRSFKAIAGVALAGWACAAAGADVFSTYEDLGEGFYGETFSHQGVTYRDVNRVSGFYPDGVPFNDTENGNQVIVEWAAPLYDDFPAYGSPANAMTFGTSFVNGENLTIGALASVWMDLDEVSNAASLDIAFYENGPWGNIEWRLEALDGGAVVASDVYTISDLGGRDNPAYTTLSVAAPAFDSLHLYGWLNGAYTAPRGIIDNLSITAVPEPGSALLLASLGWLLRRR